MLLSTIYINATDGIVYRVDDSDDRIISMEYLPAHNTCQDLIRKAATKSSGVWRNLSPLHSRRSDVERLFGQPKDSFGSDYFYDVENDAVMFRYAKGNCNPSDHNWKVPADTILEIHVTPETTILVSELELDPTEYQRVEIQHPAMFIYTNLENGVTIKTRLLGGCERVASIVYGPKASDAALSCPQRR